MINYRTFSENGAIGIPNSIYLKIQHINLFFEYFLLLITVLVFWICITLCISTWGNVADLGKISKVFHVWRLLDVRCTLPTSKPLEMKTCFLHPHGPSASYIFLYHPVISWIHQSAGLRELQKYTTVSWLMLKTYQHRNSSELLKEDNKISFWVHWQKHS
jgi:hypothetical protein